MKRGLRTDRRRPAIVKTQAKLLGEIIRRIHASASLSSCSRCCGQTLSVGPGQSGVMGPAPVSLCRMLDTNFRECLFFYELR
jgi:hypothetical protein